MPVRLSCPSCNTAFTRPAVPADGRAACPRCEDVFPVRSFTEVEDAPPPPDPPSPIPHPRFPRWSVTRSVAVALAMGLVGLGVGLWVYHGRGGVRPPGDTNPPRPKGAAVPATQLAGLGYLPADTNVAFAVQPGPVLAHAARTKQDPRELLAKVGVPAQLLDAVAAAGLTLPQIDHLAGGAAVGDGAVDFRLTLVLVLRRPPDDEDALLQRLKARRQGGGKARYDADLAGLPVVVERVSPTVWVFGPGLGADPGRNFEAVDRGGYGPGGRQFPAGLAEMVSQRVPPDAAAWLATDDGRWAEKPGVDLVVRQFLERPGWLKVLARGRAGLAAVSVGDDPRLRVFVKAADAETGRQARDYFKAAAAADQKVRVGGAGELAFYDAPVGPADAFATLQRLLGDAVGK